MRIPFLAGWLNRSEDRSEDRTRILVAEGRTPRVFPGPWRLEKVIREEDPPDPPESTPTPDVADDAGARSSGRTP